MQPTDSGDKLARFDKINHVDEKPNDSSPDVPSSREVEGEGSEDAPKDEDEWMMGPRKWRTAPNQVCEQVLHLSDTVFKMTDVNGWAASSPGPDTFVFLLFHQPLSLSAWH